MSQYSSYIYLWIIHTLTCDLVYYTLLAFSCDKQNPNLMAIRVSGMKHCLYWYNNLHVLTLAKLKKTTIIKIRKTTTIRKIVISAALYILLLNSV